MRYGFNFSETPADTIMICMDCNKCNSSIVFTTYFRLEKGNHFILKQGMQCYQCFVEQQAEIESLNDIEKMNDVL